MQNLQKNLPDHIAIDGKTVRRSFDKVKEKKAIHMISAFASNTRLVLGQSKVGDKTNEITAIPKLLDLLLIKGAIITIDAMGCQKDIVNKIREKQGDYVLAVKGNQKDLYENITTYFGDKTVKFNFHEEVDKGHGRIEIRKCFATSKIDWLDTKNEWTDLKSIVKIDSTRIIGDKETKETRYYITNINDDAEKLSKAIRSHWSIENSLHWTLDMTFREEESRIRKKNAPENIAVLRHVILNLLRNADDKISIRRRRKKAGWSDDYLENVLKKNF
jgi:predicted transposase YbfD/YdcC